MRISGVVKLIKGRVSLLTNVLKLDVTNINVAVFTPSLGLLPYLDVAFTTRVSDRVGGIDQLASGGRDCRQGMVRIREPRDVYLAGQQRLGTADLEATARTRSAAAALRPATIEGSSTTRGTIESRPLTMKFGATASGRPNTPTTFSIM